MTDHEDFMDLEDLLKESVQLASAKKAKSQGRRLHKDQAAVMMVMKQFEEKDLWGGIINIAFFEQNRCTCGNQFEVFNGWFMHQVTTRGVFAERLERVKSKSPDLDSKRFTSMFLVDGCDICAGDLPSIELSECKLLSTLSNTISDADVIGHDLAKLGNESLESLTELNDDFPEDFGDDDV